MSDKLPARPHFSPRRIGALIRRHVYLLRGSWPRLFDLVYWPTVQLAMWGFLQLYLVKRSGVAAAAAGALIGGVLLWDILFRSQLGFNLAFLEELYSRNLGHLLVSPLRPFEHILAMMVISIIRVLIGIVPVSLFVIFFFGFNVYGLGLWLVAFFLNLVLTSWAFGLFVCGLLLRYGLGAENVAWSLIFALMPLCCVYYPLAILPTWLQWISLALAPTYVFEGMRAILLQGTVEASLMVKALIINAAYLSAGALAFMFYLQDARRRGALVGMGE
jgi:ABC-2 type transport system permease protein